MQTYSKNYKLKNIPNDSFIYDTKSLIRLLQANDIFIDFGKSCGGYFFIKNGIKHNTNIQGLQAFDVQGWIFYIKNL